MYTGSYSAPCEGQASLWGSIPVDGDIRSNYFWWMLPCLAANTNSEENNRLSLNHKDVEVPLQGVQFCMSLKQFEGEEVTAVCKQERNCVTANNDCRKLVPWNSLKAFMVGVFSLKYKLPDDDGWRSTRWEVFVCVWGNFTVTTACL